MLTKLDEVSSSTLKLSYGIVEKNKEFKISSIEIHDENGVILGYKKKGVKHILESDVFSKKDITEYRTQFGKSIYFEKLKIISKEERKVVIQKTLSSGLQFKKSINTEMVDENIFIRTIYRLFEEATKNGLSSFDKEKINYVRPLRAFPQRYYFLDEANVSNSLNTIDGNQLTEILKEKEEIRDKVSEWLEKTIGSKVTVEKVKAEIHNLKIDQHGLNLDITDVGFGVSQILPVIVQGFLSQDDSLTIMEQPEIHLHPKMQADLADLFIDIVKSKGSDEKGKILLIETHSEYLLKRLRRRISEGKIKSEDVALYFVHPKEREGGSGKIEKIEISETGSFKWPKSFYSEDLIDTIEFLKHQK